MNNDAKKWAHMIAFILVIIGGLNYALFGILPQDKDGNGFDFLMRIFPNPNVFEFVALLIGVAAVYLVVTHAKSCSICAGKETK